MASVLIRPGSADNSALDGRSMATGEVRQVTSIGDGTTAANVLVVDSSGRASVAVASMPTYTQLFTNSAATTNATNVKGSAGSLMAFNVSNAGAAAAFVKLYNKATAPTVGTDVPVLTVAIPAGGTFSLALGPGGQRFNTGIGFAITNLVADSDTTAVAANQVKVMLAYV